MAKVIGDMDLNERLDLVKDTLAREIIHQEDIGQPGTATRLRAIHQILTLGAAFPLDTSEPSTCLVCGKPAVGQCEKTEGFHRV